jgi:hypothetical protein
MALVPLDVLVQPRDENVFRGMAPRVVAALHLEGQDIDTNRFLPETGFS